MSVSVRHDPFPVGAQYHGIYSHGVETRPGVRMLHVSGQVGQPPEGALPADFRGQCRQALLNVSAVLASAGMAFADIVKMSFFLVRREDMEALVEVRKELLDGVRPAITTVFVTGLVSRLNIARAYLGFIVPLIGGVLAPMGCSTIRRWSFAFPRRSAPPRGAS